MIFFGYGSRGAQHWPHNLFNISAILILAMMVAITGSSHGVSVANAAALDETAAIVKSCSFDEMLSVTKSVPTVAASDAAAICETITNSLGHKPQMNVLQAALMATSLMSIRGLKASEPEIAYQLMNIVEARGITNPDRTISTFDTVLKIFRGDQWACDAMRFEHSASQLWAVGAHLIG